jgi:hypothetical protein
MFAMCACECSECARSTTGHVRLTRIFSFKTIEFQTDKRRSVEVLGRRSMGRARAKIRKLNVITIRAGKPRLELIGIYWRYRFGDYGLRGMQKLRCHGALSTKSLNLQCVNS